MAMKKKSLKTKGKGINAGNERLFLFLCLVCGLERLEIYPLPHNPICRTRNRKKKLWKKFHIEKMLATTVFSPFPTMFYTQKETEIIISTQ